MNLGAQKYDKEVDGNVVEDGTSLLQVIILQGGEGSDVRENNCAYLESCSTVTAFKNSNLLTGVHKVEKPLRVNCNVRETITRNIGTCGSLQV